MIGSLEKELRALISSLLRGYRLSKRETVTAIRDLPDNSNTRSNNINIALSPKVKPNKTFKCDQDTFSKLCGTCIGEGIFPSLWEW